MTVSYRRLRSVGSLFGVLFVLGWGDCVSAGDDKTKGSGGVVDQIGTSVKNLATNLEKEVTGAVKKLEESETPKKVGDELKRSAESLGEKVERAGKKLKDSFTSE